MPIARREAPLPWWTRVPSPGLLTAVTSAVALAAALVVVASWPVRVAVAVVVAVRVGWAWVVGETLVRQRGTQLSKQHPVVVEVASLRRRAGLLRDPCVFVDEHGPLAAAADTAHPGSTVVVNAELLGWWDAGMSGHVRAVLAHEVAHLHRFHSTVRLLSHAAGLAAWTCVAGWWATSAVAGGSLDGWTDVALAAVAFVAFEVVVARRLEFDADADAARLGCGPELADVFDAFASASRPVRLHGSVTHPHPRTRARRLRQASARVIEADVT